MNCTCELAAIEMNPGDVSWVCPVCKQEWVLPSVSIYQKFSIVPPPAEEPDGRRQS